MPALRFARPVLAVLVLVLATQAVPALGSTRVFASSWLESDSSGRVYEYAGGTTWVDISPAGGLGMAVWDMEWIDGVLWVASQGSPDSAVWSWDGSSWTMRCPHGVAGCGDWVTTVRSVGGQVFLTERDSGIWRWNGGVTWTQVATASGMSRSITSMSQYGRDVLYIGHGFLDEFWFHDPRHLLACPGIGCPAVSGDACSAGCLAGSCIYSFAEHDDGIGLGGRVFAGAYHGELYQWEPSLREFTHAATIGSGHINGLASWHGELWIGGGDGHLYRSNGGSPSSHVTVNTFAEPISALTADPTDDLLWVGQGGAPFSEPSGTSIIRTFDGTTWVDRSLPLAFGRGVSRILVVPVEERIVCDAGEPLQAECTGDETPVNLDGTGTTFTGVSAVGAIYTWTGDFTGGTATGSLVSVGFSGCGVHDVTLTVTSGSLSASCATSVEIRDSVAPVLAGVPGDATVDCDAVPPAASVTVSDTCDSSPSLGFTEIRADGPCPGTYDLLRTWTASDLCGNSNSARQVVHVRDTTPPSVTPGSSNLHCLWPPNHRIVTFEHVDFAPAITDDCSSPVSWRVAGCAPDQPEDDRGDGHTAPDCIVAPDGRSFQVRAERDARDPRGRHYAVSVVATDACGNASEAVVIGYVHVPHDARPGQRCR